MHNLTDLSDESFTWQEKTNLECIAGLLVSEGFSDYEVELKGYNYDSSFMLTLRCANNNISKTAIINATAGCYHLG